MRARLRPLPLAALLSGALALACLPATGAGERVGMQVAMLAPHQLAPVEEPEALPGRRELRSAALMALHAVDAEAAFGLLDSAREVISAARGGDVEAMAALGALYEFGVVSLADMGAAAVWYGKAAEAGHVASQLRMAALHADGLGVRRDARRALDWLLRAIDDGGLAVLKDSAQSARRLLPNVRIRAATANLRSEPDTAAGIAAQARAGETLEVLERRDDWFRVIYPDSDRPVWVSALVAVPLDD
ncbi:SH3 domain-containing protein [Pseudothauera lacus]|nr:SH3 domain-containing protein [Pseudothauera lacus]